MKKLPLLISAITLSAVSVFSGNAIAQQATSLDDLLSQLAQGKIAQSKQNLDREAEFNTKKANKFNY